MVEIKTNEELEDLVGKHVLVQYVSDIAVEMYVVKADGCYYGLHNSRHMFFDGSKPTTMDMYPRYNSSFYLSDMGHFIYAKVYRDYYKHANLKTNEISYDVW